MTSGRIIFNRDFYFSLCLTLEVSFLEECVCISSHQWSYSILIMSIFCSNIVPNNEKTGLPNFNRASVIKIGSWYYTSALKPMRGNQTFR